MILLKLTGRTGSWCFLLHVHIRGSLELIKTFCSCAPDKPTLHCCLPSHQCFIGTLFLWSLRLFGDLETISTIGDIMNMWCPPSLKCLKRSFVAPNLAYFIHKRTQMDSSLFRTYQGKTYEPAFLFYTWKLFSCGKKSVVLHIKSEENQAGGQRKETGAVVSMPNRQVWQQNNISNRDKK